MSRIVATFMDAKSFAVFFRRNTSGCFACPPAEAAAPGLLSAILDRCGLDLDIAFKVLGERLVGDGDFLADDLVRPVLACSLDADRIGAGAERLAVVILTVPGDGVLPRRAGGPRDRIDQVGVVGFQPADLVSLDTSASGRGASAGRAAASGARVPASGR